LVEILRAISKLDASGRLGQSGRELMNGIRGRAVSALPLIEESATCKTTSAMCPVAVARRSRADTRVKAADHDLDQRVPHKRELAWTG
jgi:hypothetical protein